MATICPYCNIEVSESAIEAEDGCCPECGSVISATSSFLGEDEDENDLDDLNEQDIFGDLDEDEDFDDSEFDDEEFDDLDEEFDDLDFEDEEFEEDEES